ncbi:hypothetical protein LA6_002376 [Marinibacterium anthonyi]|nr:hypothetical protein LA6_002376 [Marinibacterium anthonyi]
MSAPVPEDMTEEDDTAALDLSIAFFSAVLMLFAFVSFQLTRTPRPEPAATLSQPDIARPVQPPTWSAVAERGSWAVYDGTRLTILDMDAIAAGMRDVLDAYDGDDGYQALTLHDDADPRSFSLRLSFRPDALPRPWQREVLQPAPDSACPETGRRLMRTYVAADVADVTGLAAYLDRCNRQFAPLPLRAASDAGRVTVQIGLTPGSYSAEAMFR